jgi:deazaflavin-dependent oxidoreductase (nitroreductase family)
MTEFSADVLHSAARKREVQLTTFGRKTGKSHRVTIWIGTDGKRLYIRSGQGMRRDWPQNLLAKGEGVVGLGKTEVKVKPRLVTDPAEARAASGLYRSKYGPFVRPSKPGEPLTLGEQTTFELLPVTT